MAQKRTPGSRTDRGPTAQQGGRAEFVKAQEAMATRRRDALIKKLMKEQGLSKEKAFEQAMKIMRDNPRRDWRQG